MNRIKILILLLSLGASGFAGWYFRGNIADTDIATLKLDHEKDRANALAKVLNETIRLNQENNVLTNRIATIDQTRFKELENAKHEQENMRRLLNDRDMRLSVLVRKTTCDSTTPAVTTGSGLDNGTERAELDKATAERIVTIANDGDNAIRQLTACQEIVKARLN